MKAMVYLMCLWGLSCIGYGEGNAAATQEGNPGQAENMIKQDAWKTQVFHGTKKPNFTKSGNGFSITNVRNVSRGKKAIVSIYQELPELDVNSDLMLSFKVKWNNNRDGNLIVAISKSPGNNIPCTRDNVSYNGDWKSYDLCIPLLGIKPSGNVFEFIWEGILEKEDELSVADISLSYNRKPSSLKMFFMDPLSGVVVVKEPAKSLSGKIHETFGRIFNRETSNGKVVKVGILPAKSLAGKTVKFTICPFEDEKIIITGKSITVSYPETICELATGPLSKGKYLIKAKVAGAPDGSAASGSIVLQKIPEAGLTFQVKEGKVYYKGKPIIPIGIFHAAEWNLERVNQENRRLGLGDISPEKAYRQLSEQGVNTVLGLTGDLNKFIEVTGREGLFLCPTVKTIDDIKNCIKDSNSFANVFAWYGSDEPVLGGRALEAVKKYRALKNLTPGIPVATTYYIAYSVHALKYRGTSADIIFFDSYPIRDENADLTETAVGLKSLYEYVKEHPDLVMGLTPQCFIYQGSEPTPGQLKAQVYIGVVNNARAFTYYAYNADYHDDPFTAYKKYNPGTPDGMSKNPARTRWWICDSKLWDIFPAISAELNALQDYVLYDGEPVSCRCSDAKIQFNAKKTPAGIEYLVAVNPTAKRISARFKFSGQRKLSPVFDTPELKTASATVELVFNPYERKVYKILAP